MPIRSINGLFAQVIRPGITDFYQSPFWGGVGRCAACSDVRRLNQSGDDALRLWTEREQLGYALYDVNEDDPTLCLLDSQNIRTRLLGPMTPASQTFINLQALQPSSDRLPALSDLFKRA